MFNRIHYGHCIDSLARIPERCVRLVLADLPDGRTKLKNKRPHWNSEIDLPQLWSSLRRVCYPNAAIVLFASQPFASRLVASNERAFRFDMIWRKSRPTNVINARIQPLRAHEHVLVFADRPPLYRPQRTHGHKPIEGRVPRKGDTTRLATSVLDFQSVGQRGRTHSAQKPEDLLRHLILSFTIRGELVLDPTAGSGSTLVAAKQLGRRFIGFEWDGETFVKAQKRLASTTTLELCR
jgi:site-specific DNA-methyltransferase (adenine-specific)